MAIDRFELPRDDWYDSDGRVYKDALIENFNAIEEKLNGLQNLSPIDVQELDWDTVSIADTTLLSDENKVVNIKSLANIMKFDDNMPVAIEIDGKKIVKLIYYHDGLKNTITDRTLDIDDGEFVWFDPSDGSTSVIDSDTLLENIDNNVDGFLLGGFTGGQLYLSFVPRLIDYDVLGALAKMKVTPVRFTNGLGKNSQTVYRDRVAGRRLGATCINKRAGSMHSLILPDSGYEPDGTR